MCNCTDSPFAAGILHMPIKSWGLLPPRLPDWGAEAPQSKAMALEGGSPQDFMYMCKTPGPDRRRALFKTYTYC